MTVVVTEFIERLQSASMLGSCLQCNAQGVLMFLLIYVLNRARSNRDVSNRRLELNIKVFFKLVNVKI